ncbi:MAG: 16S rRNA (adenine(1518)-N(6)/adenine(1519)-N(6))-dimethyltransferase RsmA [Armatimonadota bacterium]|nr:16S rRNA (adenine(1518)-N(6)/adenine(1519)-N(6))-dimethyltransferase RsmA [Armatimonadota bacterium]
MAGDPCGCTSCPSRARAASSLTDELSALAHLDLATPAGVRAALRAAGLRLRPSRGQHFLVDRRVLARIVEAAAPDPTDLVLEIGAGIGTLTVALARTGAAVAAVEVDPRFIPVLRATCAPYPGVRILHADAMALAAEMLPGVPTKVVANLPYSIASPLLITLLEAGWGRRFVVMVQEEVARRIVAGPDTEAYGLLSVAVQAHALPTIVSLVPRRAFFPPPQVTSAIVRLEVPDPPPVPRPLVSVVMTVARAAFGQRRKMLRTALRAARQPHLPPETVEALCLAAGIDARRRGESLSLAEFVRLAEVLADRDGEGRSGSDQGG